MLRLYEENIASLGQARRVAGISKWDFLELPAREGIPLHTGEEELREDLRVAKKLARKTGTVKVEGGRNTLALGSISQRIARGIVPLEIYNSLRLP